MQVLYVVFIFQHLCDDRVPYQNVVVGLVSNQLLIQCVCVLLLRGTHNTVTAEQGIVTDYASVGCDAADNAAASDNCHGDNSANLLASIPPLPGLSLMLIVTSPLEGMRCIVMCLSVCLSVCLLTYLENHMAELRQIFCACYLWPGLCLRMTELQYVMYFRFYGWCVVCIISSSSLFVSGSAHKIQKCVKKIYVDH